jgi:tripartite ATP-independent transporter DctM subunit
MEHVGFIGLGVFITLLILGVPVTFAMGAVSIIGLMAVTGVSGALPQVMMVGMQTGTDFILLCIPLFVFMGKMVLHTGIARELFTCVEAWFGRLRGGLLISSVITCAAFGAVTGSSSASVATMTGILRPELRRYNYDDGLSAGAITSAGTLAILIPPSAGFIFYGVLTDTSVGKLFLAGVLPGLLSTAFYCIYCWLRCLIQPKLGPIGAKHTWTEKIISLKGTWGFLVLFAIVIGGIYSGICTPTEAAGVGVVGVLGISLIQRRLNLRALKNAMIDTAYVAAMIYGIILTGYLLARFLAVSGASKAIVDFVAAMGLSQYTFLLIIAILYLILGTMLDMFGLLILSLPFFFPLVQHFQIDPIWFGVFAVIMAEVGLLSPPVGVNVFVMHACAPDIPMSKIFSGVLPFMGINLVVVLILAIFPIIATWLPSIAMK